MRTLGEFRKRTAHLPDDTDIVADEGDLEAWEVEIDDRSIHPPVLDLPTLLVLKLQQPVTIEKAYHHRIDAQHLAAGFDIPKGGDERDDHDRYDF